MSEKLTDEDFIASARKACANSIMNTATGAYLDEALQRLDRNQTEIKRLRDHAKSLTRLFDARLRQRWDDNAEYRAEIDRLREALQQIITHQSLLTELADKTGASIIAREALTTGNNHYSEGS
jgi:DNA repair exonuclease SbcCD ATPase subunit